LAEGCTALAAKVRCRRVFRLTFCALLCEGIPALRAEVICRGIIRPAVRAVHSTTLPTGKMAEYRDWAG
jgi:hypothetical protein